MKEFEKCKGAVTKEGLMFSLTERGKEGDCVVLKGLERTARRCESGSPTVFK